MSQASSDTPQVIDRRSSANMERHFQTILISIITGAIIFAANYFYTDNRGKAVQQTQLEVLTAQVIEMRADLRSLQTNYVRREELREVENRLDRKIDSALAMERRK